MHKSNLKRFEKLENIPAEILAKQGLRISKRFENLEIGDKKIELTITDKITPQEEAPSEVIYYVFCPYCGAENEIKSEICIRCHQNLQEPAAKNYKLKTVVTKKCSICGAINREDREDCWICGRNFFLKRGEKPKINTDNVISLNIDGKEYKSTDKELPLEIVVLMERIRRDGYSSKLIDEWMKERNKKFEERKEGLEFRLSNIKDDIILRIAGLFLISIISLLWLRSCR